MQQFQPDVWFIRICGSPVTYKFVCGIEEISSLGRQQIFIYIFTISGVRITFKKSLDYLFIEELHKQIKI